MTNKEENIEILGVRVDNFSVAEIEKKLIRIIENGPEQKFATTLNPEILLKARQDEKYRDILNSADMNVCDGFGLKLVSFLRGENIKAIFPGVDLVGFLLSKAEKMGQKVLVVAAEKSLSSPAEIEWAIGNKYPKISAKSQYFPAGQNFFKNGIINQAEIVFVNFGAPEQERFIFENRCKFPNAKILIGVGGAFDFFTGKIRRAPRFFQMLGLEWFWRLAQEPKRLRRIWNAVIIFPLTAIRN